MESFASAEQAGHPCGRQTVMLVCVIRLWRVSHELRKQVTLIPSVLPPIPKEISCQLQTQKQVNKRPVLITMVTRKGGAGGAVSYV